MVGRTDALVERDAAVEQLRTALDAAGTGSGGVIIVEGEAGVGKTALIDVAIDEATDRGFEVMTAACSELEHEFAYGAVRQLYEPVMRDRPDSEVAELLAGAAQLGAPLVTGHGPDLAGTDPVFAIRHGLYWLTDNLAARRPLLIAVDDAQWADLDSLGFLTHLGRRLEGLPGLVVLGWRLGDVPAQRPLRLELERQPWTALLPLRPLSREGVATLVGDRLADPGDEDFRRACADASGGNPFLICELIGTLQRSGATPTADAVGRAIDIDRDGLARSIVTRLARLADDAVGLARALAVLDRDAHLEHAGRLAGLDVDAAADAAAALQRAGLLAAGGPLRFTHPLLRQAVYADLAPASRDRLHRRAAELLDGAGAADRGATHLVAISPAADPWVAERLLAAGGRALAHGAPQAALALLERALAESAGPRDEILAALGTAELLVGRPSSEARLRAAAASGADVPTRLHAARLLALHLADQARPAEAAQLLDEMVTERALTDEQRLELEADRAIFGVADDAMASAAGARIEKVAATCSGETAPEREVLVALAFHRARTAATTADDVVRLLDRAGPTPRRTESLSVYCRAATLSLAGHLEEARTVLEELLAEDRHAGAPAWVSSSAMYSSQVALQQGRVLDAEAFIGEAFDAVGEDRFPHGLPMRLAVLLDVLRARDRLDEAAAALAAQGYDTAPVPPISTGLPLLRARTALRLALGEVEGAVADSEEILARERVRGGLPLGPCLDAALALHAAGQVDLAREVCGRELERAKDWGVTAPVGAAQRVLGLVAGDLALLAASVDTLEDAGAPLELAASLAEQGAALRRSRQREACRAPLRRALDLAHRGGAAALAARAEAELRATGARPRRLLVSGVEALTASERRVADLAAAGRSNPEIAQALFVTRKTVESHLAHVYQKLDIGSRTQLGEALASSTPGVP
jgi:DNA-binding CsgD family transcriptional regulator